MLDLAIAEADPATPTSSQAPDRLRAPSPPGLGVANQGRPADTWLYQTAQLGWRRILVKLAIDLRVRLFTDAEDEAVRIFAANLRDVLLAARPETGPRWGLIRAAHRA